MIREGGLRVECAMGKRERVVGCKRDSSHLVTNALGMDLETKKDNGDSGGFYDCNRCLDMAKEPVVTCCGHLFCWACYYQFSIDWNSNAKECPICRGRSNNVSSFLLQKKEWCF